MKQMSWKSNVKHAVLEHLIKEIDSAQDMSRAGITNRAIKEAEELPMDCWVEIAKEIPNLPKLDISVPTGMQIRVDSELEEKLSQVEANIKKALDLERLQTQYEIQLLWLNYLKKLKLKAMNVGVEKKNDLTGPDMVKKLVQILLLNREADKEIIEKIKALLINWEE